MLIQLELKREFENNDEVFIVLKVVDQHNKALKPNRTESLIK